MLSRVALPFTILLAALLAGCGATEPSTNRPLTRVDPSWVTGEAALRLQPNGRFDLADLVNPEGGDITEAAARDLATFVVHLLATAVGNLAVVVQEDHGAPLDFTSLASCSRTLWQRSPWIPSDTGPHYLKNAIGSHYWFLFCTQSGTLALFQEVAARSGATLSSDGHLSVPSGSGNDFATFGIPLAGWYEMSPEVAVDALVHALPRKVAAIGEFTGCPLSVPACFGADGFVWHLYIDRPIRVRRRSDLGELDVVDVYVTANQTLTGSLKVLIPELAQPPDQWLYDSSVSAQDSVWIMRRGPVRFSEIDVIGQ